jgi:hypothetical protein
VEDKSMEHTEFLQFIDDEIEELETIKGKNTILVPMASASIATLNDLKRRVEESVEQVSEP